MAQHVKDPFKKPDSLEIVDEREAKAKKRHAHAHTLEIMRQVVCCV